jgi:hypothetical protein
MSSTKKKMLGQFYTTNYEYILQNMKIPLEVKCIVEPFVGSGELLKFVNKNVEVECYDIEIKDIEIKDIETKDIKGIEIKNIKVIKQDTLKNPPNYKGKFVITNPPYLAKNKNKDKSLYDIYGKDDLYKCFISQLCNGNDFSKDMSPIGGIIIIPLNFFCSIRKADIDLRKTFLEMFTITTLNIFEEPVFDDTSYTVCCFQFEKRLKQGIKHSLSPIKTYFYPSGKTISLIFSDYIIGGEIYSLKKSKTYTITRATSKTNPEYTTNILLKCIDDKTQINLSLVTDDKKYIDTTPNLSARSYATLVVVPKLTLEKQTLLVERFNLYITDQREKYNSLFLTNYREDSRKRISFELAFRICSYLLNIS